MSETADNNDDKKDGIVVRPITLLETYQWEGKDGIKFAMSIHQTDDCIHEIVCSERDAKKLRDALNQMYPAWKDNI
jgi:hypothetical protein